MNSSTLTDAAPFGPLNFDPLLRPIFGGDSGGHRGIGTEADALVTRTADGTDINAVWDEFRSALAAYNSERSALVSLLTFSTTLSNDVVPQTLQTTSEFEVASEFGEPVSARVPSGVLRLGYTLNDYDLASRLTWKFLRDSDIRQVEAQFADMLAADNRLVNRTVLKRLFDPTPGENEWGHTVYGLYTGNDGFTPPPYAGQTFPSTTKHFIASQSALIDSADIEDLLNLLGRKGFGSSEGQQLLILAHPNESEVIQTWRRGVGNGTGGAIISRFDFIPSQSAPAYIEPDGQIIGQAAPGEYNGLKVVGSLGPSWLVESSHLPAGYVAVVATGGPNAQSNAIGVREHTNPQYRGLRLIPGAVPDYPLRESFLARTFGVGVRRRGAAAVAQITTNATYSAPTWAW
ncbi:hypothetical protein CH249_15410 [Rhodococcus sp. 05-2255-3B1]|uniref:hypothetical protein n=1 Tax=unclassified Rhodococcus (in: high G+C Gram-positive bacteria) TaxID=192944 RepID=UPI000B9C7572|nr:MULTISPECIES: hypothetical protein [unclassified Rhodococcus (in: high G+C Gram-positive bacteria)]OZE03177.1 hypothetical protein CH250_23475 [Rhodococcus sp. 05-2255-3C]OZE09566.1 hypothetical protein CH249_15410 [Rhodococcus sp. 05-2255-3B1]OZE14832.1 hypothetical protein CH255_21755 [Rhodococcus sp. 05-2255-2A2]